MFIQVLVENIKCDGCANHIRKQLSTHMSVTCVDIDINEGLVNVSVAENETTKGLRAQLVAQLLKMGYPETGSVEGLKAVSAKAKSFVSCAVGRLSDNETPS